MIFDLLNPPKGLRGRAKTILHLHTLFMRVTHTPNLVEFHQMVIPVDLICHMTMFEKNDPCAPQRPNQQFFSRIGMILCPWLNQY